MISYLLPLALAPVLCCADPAEEPAYLKAGTPEVGGIRHLCLIYHGQKRRVVWTKDALLPYVAYVDEQGKPTDWLFDSFLFIEFANDAGTYLHHHVKDKPQPTAADWQWLADCWFRQKTGMIDLEGAVAQAGKTLGQPGRTVNVVVTLPVPLGPLRKFGPLAGQDKTLDFSREKDRQQALAWYVDRVLGNYASGSYPHLRLAGFYWTSESMAPPDWPIVGWMSEFLHGKGYKFYWIPYFGAAGMFGWQKRGIDAVMFQPNHFFTKKPDPLRLMNAAKRAKIAGAGIEVEFDARALTSDDHRQRFYEYLDAGVKYGWAEDTVVGWYEGGGAIGQLLKTPGVGRELYSCVYRFVKGTYSPSGRSKLPELTVVRRDSRGNLALASKGAKISGCIRPQGQPALAPEQIIDGSIFYYTGASGFGYFGLPGSFTIELPQTTTVARTQTLLWDLDGRHFRYKIDTSADKRSWEAAVDKSSGQWSAWQVDKFSPRKARYVRFTGLHNSAKQSLFQVVEFEVYGR